MGIMDLLGKASGASGFGSAFGRSVFDNGLALGKAVEAGERSSPVDGSDWLQKL